MASGNFDYCLRNFTWRPENDGQGLHDDAGDSGGSTRLGVTWRTFQAWRATSGAVPLDTQADAIAALRGASVDEIVALYRVMFWNTINGDRLPAGIDLLVFDFGVTAGCVRSARLLQAFVKPSSADPGWVDGQIGPETLGAIGNFDAVNVIAGLTNSQLRYYANLPSYAEFGRGWDRRTEDRRKAALAMQQFTEA